MHVMRISVLLLMTGTIAMGQSHEGHKIFDAEKWKSKFGVTNVQAMARPIDSPVDACEVLKARKVFEGDVQFSSKSHLFVWSVGEPSKRYLTKVGGLPYLRKGVEWPVDENGVALPFCIQFCFVDSHKIVNAKLPGDVLLVFGRVGSRKPEWRTVWQSIDANADLVGWDDLGAHLDVTPLYGNLLELDVCDGWQQRWEESENCYDGVLFQPWGTQICREPFTCAKEVPLKKKDNEFILCCFGGISANRNAQPSFVNSHEFYSPKFDRVGYATLLEPGVPFDSGNIYITFNPTTSKISFHLLFP